MGEDVVVTRTGPVWTLSLNRPDRINALRGGMLDALLAALRQAGDDPSCRAIMLRGEGNGFCSGQDLSDLPADVDLGQVLRERYAPVIHAIRTLPKPVLCAVHGVAAGAGANLALACDIVLAGHSARFVQAFIRIGLIPDVGGTWMLPRLIGQARARAIAMLGDPVAAPQAQEWGMIWRAVPDDALFAEADALARRLASLPTVAIGLIKHAFDSAAANTLAQQLEVEAELQAKAGRTPDFAEGVQAFLTKRPPVFTGAGNPPVFIGTNEATSQRVAKVPEMD